MKWLTLVLLSCAVLFAAEKAEEKTEVEKKTKSQTVSLQCDTIQIVRCTETKVMETLKDTSLVVDRDTVKITVVDTLGQTGDQGEKKDKKDKKKKRR